MQHEVIISRSCTVRLSISTAMAMLTLCWSFLIEFRNGCCVGSGPEPTACTFILLCVCLHLKLLLMFDAVWAREITSRMCCSMHHNDSDGSGLIFVCWIINPLCHVGSWRTSGNREYVYVTVRLVLAVLVMFDAVCSYYLTFENTTMAMMGPYN